MDGLPVTSGGTTAQQRVGKHQKAGLLNNLHWFDNCPLLLPWLYQHQLETPSLLCLSQLKHLKGETWWSHHHSDKRKNYSPSNDDDDKEVDYLPVTKHAINNIMKGKGTWEEDVQHRNRLCMSPVSTLLTMYTDTKKYLQMCWVLFYVWDDTWHTCRAKIGDISTRRQHITDMSLTFQAMVPATYVKLCSPVSRPAVLH